MDSKNKLIDMVVNQYFKSVDQYDVQGVLDCFCEDASFVIHSGNPAEHHGRAEIQVVFEELFKNYPNRMIHKDFQHVVDGEKDSIASQFNVELKGVDNEEEYQTNCNFFYLENGKFKNVYVYMMGVNVLTGK